MRYWLGVVSEEHVRHGVGLGIGQIGHGKKAGLARMEAGDWLVYYSPRSLEGMAPLQTFTAIGQIADEEIWQAEEGAFKLWRRRIDYVRTARHVPLEALRSRLEMLQSKNWGYQLRRGLVELSQSDFAVIRAAMTSPQ